MSFSVVSPASTTALSCSPQIAGRSTSGANAAPLGTRIPSSAVPQWLLARAPDDGPAWYAPVSDLQLSAMHSGRKAPPRGKTLPVWALIWHLSGRDSLACVPLAASISMSCIGSSAACSEGWIGALSALVSATRWPVGEASEIVSWCRLFAPQPEYVELLLTERRCVARILPLTWT